MWIQLISPDSRGVYLALRKKEATHKLTIFKPAFLEQI